MAESLADHWNETNANYIRNLGIDPITPTEAYNLRYGGPVNWDFVDYECEEGCYGRTLGSNSVRVYSDAVVSQELVIHEFGHAFNATLPSSAYDVLNNYGIWVDDVQVAGYSPNVNSENHYLRTDLGYPSVSKYQQNLFASPNEDFADMFLNWVLGTFTNDSYGRARRSFMNQFMP